MHITAHSDRPTMAAFLVGTGANLYAVDDVRSHPCLFRIPLSFHGHILTSALFYFLFSVHQRFLDYSRFTMIYKSITPSNVAHNITLIVLLVGPHFSAYCCSQKCYARFYAFDREGSSH